MRTKGSKRQAYESAARPPLSVDWPELGRVMDFMAVHGLEEFEYASGELHIRLKRAGTPAHVFTPSVLPVAAPPPNPGNPPVAAPVAAPAVAQPPAPAPAEELHSIKSPIVGTFYAAPNAEAPPFVKVGDHVSAGQVLCIVEAMKLMNEIESDVNGEIARIHVQNGQPVEYGEPMFDIRPEKK